MSGSRVFNRRSGRDGTAQATSAGGVLGDPKWTVPSLWWKQRGRKLPPDSHPPAGKEDVQVPQTPGPGISQHRQVSGLQAGGLWVAEGAEVWCATRETCWSVCPHWAPAGV